MDIVAQGETLNMLMYFVLNFYFYCLPDSKIYLFLISKCFKYCGCGFGGKCMYCNQYDFTGYYDSIGVFHNNLVEMFNTNGLICSSDSQVIIKVRFKIIINFCYFFNFNKCQITIPCKCYNSVCNYCNSTDFVKYSSTNTHYVLFLNNGSNVAPNSGGQVCSSNTEDVDVNKFNL